MHLSSYPQRVIEFLLPGAFCWLHDYIFTACVTAGNEIMVNSQVNIDHSIVLQVLNKNVKVKWSRYRPGVAQRVGRGIALLYHDRGTIRGWVVSSTLPPGFYKLCSSPNELEKGLKISVHFLLTACFQQNQQTCYILSFNLYYENTFPSRVAVFLVYHLIDVLILWAGTIWNVFSNLPFLSLYLQDLFPSLKQNDTNTLFLQFLQ